MTHHAWRLVAWPAVAALALGSCAPVPTPDPLALVARAIERTSRLQSVHFMMNVTNGSIRLGPSLDVVKAEGDVARPDDLHVRATTRMGGLIVESELIHSAAGTFYQNPFNGRWEQLSTELAPIPLLDPERGIVRLMKAVTQLTIQGTDRAGSVTVWHANGQVPAAAVTELVGGDPVSDSVSLETLIGDDGLVRHLVITGAIVQGENVATTRTFDFSEFDSAQPINTPTL